MAVGPWRARMRAPADCCWRCVSLNSRGLPGPALRPTRPVVGHLSMCPRPKAPVREASLSAWCEGHRRGRFSMSVGPPRDHDRRWWTSPWTAADTQCGQPQTPCVA